MTRFSEEWYAERQRKDAQRIGKPITAGGAIREDARGMVSPSVTPATPVCPHCQRPYDAPSGAA